MKRFIDTSVLVSASIGSHTHHEPSAKLYGSLKREEDCCAAHTLAELYSTLTRLPLSVRFRPEQAMLVVAAAEARLSVIALDAAEYLSVIDEFAKRRVGGGMIYDALLIANARKSHAALIYTWDVRHFRMVAPDLAERIVEPA